MTGERVLRDRRAALSRTKPVTAKTFTQWPARAVVARCSMSHMVIKYIIIASPSRLHQARQIFHPHVICNGEVIIIINNQVR